MKPVILNKDPLPPVNGQKYTRMVNPGELLFVNGRGLIELTLDLRMGSTHIYKTFKEGEDYVVLPFKNESSKWYGYVNIVPIKDETNFRSTIVSVKDWPEYAMSLADGVKNFKRHKGKTVEEIAQDIMKMDAITLMPCLHITVVEDWDRDEIYNMPRIEVSKR